MNCMSSWKKFQNFISQTHCNKILRFLEDLYGLKLSVSVRSETDFDHLATGHTVILCKNYLCYSFLSATHPTDHFTTCPVIFQ